MQPIDCPYLLITCIDCYRDSEGHRYLDQLWYKDLIEHFKYLKNFTLAAPCRYEAPPPGSVRLDNDPAFAGVQFVDLPAPNSFGQAVRQLPQTFKILWQAIARAEVVHTGVAGWPIPPGWLVTPLIYLRKKFYLIIVESAFWRVEPNAPSSWKARLRAGLSEQINRWCLNKTDLAIFTQQEYRQSLLTHRPERGHIIHASWIDEENVLAAEVAQESWKTKVNPETSRLKLLYAGRLSSGKGVSLLLQAIEKLSQESFPVQLDILGQGDLRGEAEKLQQQLQGPTRVNLLGTVPYGPALFQLIRDYHAVVLPLITDEQPRIVYDAYSQAVPVLASNTNGLRDCVQDGQTGKLFAANDTIALVNAIRWAAANLPELSDRGMTSLEVARKMTHQEMHRQRWQLLLQALA